RGRRRRDDRRRRHHEDRPRAAGAVGVAMVSDDLEGDELELDDDAAPPREVKRSSPKGERKAQRRSDAAPRSNTRLALAGIAVVLALSAPLWGPLFMRRMAFFRVRRIEILSAHYVSPSDLLARLRVDTSASVWDPAEP